MEELTKEKEKAELADLQGSEVDEDAQMEDEETDK